MTHLRGKAGDTGPFYLEVIVEYIKTEEFINEVNKNIRAKE